ncbi:MAG TPA: hypothetical protein VFB32_10210 [Rudaea sp.]|nr:hypothetical protein [Rudaea sp.]
MKKTTSGPTMPERLAIVFGFALLSAAAFADPANPGNGTSSTPSSGEMSPSEWRRLQLVAADKSDRIMRDAQKQPGLLAQYEYMQRAYDLDHERAFQVIFGQYLSWYQTFVGDYNGGMTSFSIAQPAQPDDAPSPLSQGLKAESAADVILARAKDRKAVFFNEAHNEPITRSLTVELLAKLREQGYNYFAAETLYDTDHDLQKRGYPTPKSGFYVDEPIYGEMVRTALKLGYKVVPYDVENAGAGDAREKAGAEKLYTQVFKKDPNARLVVNAGFAHVQKTGKYLGGSSMGEFFRQISGIDPLTIEQTMLIQHARPDQDHPYYLAVMAALHPQQPVVFVAADGKPWTLKPGQYDMSVFFPQFENVKQRPDWLTLGGLRAAYPVGSELCHNQFPCLIEARCADERDDAVAADRAVLNVVNDDATPQQRVIAGHGEVSSRLFLRPGKYRITATDTSNRLLYAREVEIGGGGAP